MKGLNIKVSFCGFASFNVLLQGGPLMMCSTSGTVYHES